MIDLFAGVTARDDKVGVDVLLPPQPMMLRQTARPINVASMRRMATADCKIDRCVSKISSGCSKPQSGLWRSCFVRHHHRSRKRARKKVNKRRCVTAELEKQRARFPNQEEFRCPQQNQLRKYLGNTRATFQPAWVYNVEQHTNDRFCLQSSGGIFTET